MKSALIQLHEVRELLARGWCQGAYAKTDRGRPIGPNETPATCFCLTGACIRVVGDGPGMSGFLAHLRETLELRGWEYHSIPIWNDSPGRTQAEVLALVDETIERLHGDERA